VPDQRAIPEFPVYFNFKSQIPSSLVYMNQTRLHCETSFKFMEITVQEKQNIMLVRAVFSLMLHFFFVCLQIMYSTIYYRRVTQCLCFWLNTNDYVFESNSAPEVGDDDGEKFFPLIMMSESEHKEFFFAVFLSILPV
jgi:hypothetical protein